MLLVAAGALLFAAVSAAFSVCAAFPLAALLFVPQAASAAIASMSIAVQTNFRPHLAIGLFTPIFVVIDYHSQ
ncbi:hypothetical protein D3C73_1563550 [compost metagenome]